MLSVALSLGSPPPVVNRHRVSMEPGLSSPAAFRLSRVRPPGRLAPAYKGSPASNCNRNPALGRDAMRQDYRVQFVTAATLAAMPAKARGDGSLDKQLTSLARPKLLIVDELGYLPIEAQCRAPTNGDRS